MFKNIIINLVENAIKFTEEGYVEFGFKVNTPTYDESKNFNITTNSSVELEIFVNDSGIGIAPDQLAMIFDEFYQIDGNPVGKNGGLGLGLSIVERSVNLLGTNIEVESALGQGSSFSLAVPAAA